MALSTLEVSNSGAQARLLYPTDYDEVWILDAERRTISQHLDELGAEELVARDGEGRYHAR